MPYTFRFSIRRSPIRRDTPDDTIRNQEADWNGGNQRRNEEDYRRQPGVLGMKHKGKRNGVVRNEKVASSPYRVNRCPPDEPHGSQTDRQVEQVPRALSTRSTRGRGIPYCRLPKRFRASDLISRFSPNETKISDRESQK
jgi:hypothetical protein